VAPQHKLLTLHGCSKHCSPSLARHRAPTSLTFKKKRRGDSEGFLYGF
jgi:hypothetical protein